MARAGDVIEHPVTGERMTFLKTAEDTGGEYVRLELAVGPHGFVAAPHIHPRQEESFEIHQGTFTFVLDGKERRVGPGEGATVPPGTPHAWWNPGDEPGLAIFEIRPALKAEEFFETMFGLAQDGKVSPETGATEPVVDSGTYREVPPRLRARRQAAAAGAARPVHASCGRSEAARLPSATPLPEREAAGSICGCQLARGPMSLERDVRLANSKRCANMVRGSSRGGA